MGMGGHQVTKSPSHQVTKVEGGTRTDLATTPRAMTRAATWRSRMLSADSDGLV